MKGVLLVNTGSPATCQRRDVKAFIRAMLSDPYVMTVADWFRPILVNGIIIPLRQFASTSHYEMIWDHKLKDSPLLHHTKLLGEKLEAYTEMPVEIAMRYGKPDICSALDRLLLKNKKLHEVVVLPLFPQYAESSYKTVVDAVGRCFYKKPYPFRLRIIEPYFSHPAYIKALAKSIKPFVEKGFERLLFNYHSLPLDHIEAAWKKGKDFDYIYQTKETERLVLNELNIDARKSNLVYSSAMGRNWLKPYLDDTLEVLAKEGLKKVVVVAPGFAADNLETLFDIGIKAKEIFLKNGGSELVYVPSLNSSDHWVEAVSQIIA